jgi:hypothetical protein
MLVDEEARPCAHAHRWRLDLAPAPSRSPAAWRREKREEREERRERREERGEGVDKLRFAVHVFSIS